MGQIGQDSRKRWISRAVEQSTSAGNLKDKRDGERAERKDPQPGNRLQG